VAEDILQVRSRFLCLSSMIHYSSFLYFTLIGKLREELGCEDVVGVDISANMNADARASEEAHPLGLVYHVFDVLNLAKPEKKFDIVVAFYLLNYAKTIDELDRMVQIIGEQLNDSDKAHFLSITLNVRDSENIINPDRYPSYRCEAQTPLVDGAPIKNTIINSDGSSFSFTNYYFSPAIYEQAFKKAGFKHFEWVPVTVARNIDNYEDFLKFPDVIGILAHK
jgi:toxoflavin synthase